MIEKSALLTTICVLLSACAHKEKTLAPQKMVFNYGRYQLEVIISGGKAAFNNIDGLASYTPLHFYMDNNKDAAFNIEKSGDNFFHSTTELKAKYKDGMLYIDTALNPLSTNKNKTPSHTFSFNPEWMNGQTYKFVNTQGMAGLDGATVTIKLNRKRRA